MRCARQFSLNGFYGESKKKAGDRRKPQVCQENCPEVEVKKSHNIVVIPFNLLNFLPVCKMFHELLASWTPPRCTISLGT